MEKSKVLKEALEKADKKPISEAKLTEEEFKTLIEAIFG